uniref:Uncharacterized protein n=1 Tax=viral metagenome TaxID=1070528 RepID=A0A6C0B200_9ZZZZ
MSSELLPLFYDSLCYDIFDEKESTLDSILKYLNNPDSLLNYDEMDLTISRWLTHVKIMARNQELDTVYDVPVSGLRVQVYQNYGKAVYDSYNKETPGQGFRSYIIGCQLSPQGISSFKKYDKKTNTHQLFFAVRQGEHSNKTLGMIVIGIDAV